MSFGGMWFYENGCQASDRREALMGIRLRLVGRIVVAVLAVSSLGGCGNQKPPPTASQVMRSSGEGGMAGGRQVKFDLDGPGGITPGGTRSTNGVVEETPAIVHFTGGKVTVEKARVLLNNVEVAKLPDDTKVVAVDYTAGTLTITADGKKVYETTIRE